MKILEDLSKRLRLYAGTPNLEGLNQFADTLDAYIKAQGEPVAELIVVETPDGIGYLWREHGFKRPIVPGTYQLYTTPPPREPTTREALRDALGPADAYTESRRGLPAYTIRTVMVALKYLGVEVTP